MADEVEHMTLGLSAAALAGVDVGTVTAFAIEQCRQRIRMRAEQMS